MVALFAARNTALRAAFMAGVPPVHPAPLCRRHHLPYLITTSRHLTSSHYPPRAVPPTLFASYLLTFLTSRGTPISSLSYNALA